MIRSLPTHSWQTPTADSSMQFLKPDFATGGVQVQILHAVGGEE
jgi:hypothetical protein